MKFFTRKIKSRLQNPVEKTDATQVLRLRQTSLLMPTLGEQLDPRQPLKQLADNLPWSEFEQAFGKYYSEEGRPAKAVRLMVGLLLLKQMFNQGDETAVAAWGQNPYWQYFCGMSEFQRQLPCDPIGLVYFHKRVGDPNACRRILIRVVESLTRTLLRQDHRGYLEKFIDFNHLPDRAQKLVVYPIGAFGRVAIVTADAPTKPSDPDDEVFILCALDGQAHHHRF